jgi:hypothetical protein
VTGVRPLPEPLVGSWGGVLPAVAQAARIQGRPELERDALDWLRGLLLQSGPLGGFSYAGRQLAEEAARLDPSFTARA